MEPRILVVDDNPIMTDTLATLFDAEDLKYCICTNGQDALEKVTTFKPNLIVLDIIMEGLNGHEVCRKIKKDLGLKNIYIIMLSGEDSAKQIAKAKIAGADDYMVKPFPPKDILKHIKKVFCTVGK